MLEFKDISWKAHSAGEGIMGSLVLNEVFTLSVVAGPAMYCTPKTKGTSPEEYSSFEVAIFEDEEFMENPRGWQDRDEINKLIEELLNK
jgi:hypothetical protein